ncbi:MAG: hypothetical protein AAFV01_10455, partial [Bacteroidota bacterium]
RGTVRGAERVSAETTQDGGSGPGAICWHSSETLCLIRTTKDNGHREAAPTEQSGQSRRVGAAVA